MSHDLKTKVQEIIYTYHNPAAKGERKMKYQNNYSARSSSYFIGYDTKNDE